MPVVLPLEMPVLPPNAVVRQPAWPQARTIPPGVSVLAPTVGDAIRQSFVPVLLPADAALSSRAFLVIRATGYSAAIDDAYSGVNASIGAEAISYSAPHRELVANTTVRGIPAHLGSTEIGLAIGWTEFGISYEVQFGCAVRDSSYCTQGAIAAFANSLVYAGGRGASR